MFGELWYKFLSQCLAVNHELQPKFNQIAVKKKTQRKTNVYTECQKNRKRREMIRGGKTTLGRAEGLLHRRYPTVKWVVGLPAWHQVVCRTSLFYHCVISCPVPQQASSVVIAVSCQVQSGQERSKAKRTSRLQAVKLLPPSLPTELKHQLIRQR